MQGQANHTVALIVVGAMVHLFLGGTQLTDIKRLLAADSRCVYHGKASPKESELESATSHVLCSPTPYQLC